MRASFAFLAPLAGLLATSVASPVESGLSKRFTDEPLEHWETSSEEACPWHGVGIEPIPVNAVALSTKWFNGGAECRTNVNVTYQGTTYTALILDECTDCAPDGLGIIAQFWNELAGSEATTTNVIYGDWVFA